MMHFKVVSGRDGGSGSFLCPPGHPRHTYSLHGYASPRSRSAILIAAVDSALTDPEVPDSVRASVQRIMDTATLIPSEAWIGHLYGYFRNMYAPESGTRNVSEAVNDPANQTPADRHLAVMYIREYFPDHEPRTDLIANPGKGYGSWPCLKCGQRVQYEAKFDAYAIMTPTGGYIIPCAKGGAHIITPDLGAPTTTEV